MPAPRPASLFSLLQRGLARPYGPAAVLALCLLLTAIFAILLSRSAQARDQARFEHEIRVVSDRITGRLDAYIALLRATASHLTTQGPLSHAELARYAAELNLPQHYPGIQGIGFSLRFSRAEREEVERRVREEGLVPGFRVWPEVEADEIHSIVMLEPLDRRNRAALGFNMHSEPIRREAMDRARDTGLPALSGKVILKQEIDEDKQAGFLLYTPVYRNGRTPDTLAERHRDLVGFIYSPFRAADLLEGIFRLEAMPNLAFRLYDGTATEPEQLLVQSPRDRPFPRSPHYTGQARIDVAGRPWTLAFATLPQFEAHEASRGLSGVVLAGVLIGLALFAMTRAEARARSEAENAAQVLRASLEERERVAAQLREADRRKDEFLAMLSHELRNPLAPMLTAIRVLEHHQATGQDITRERQVIERHLFHLRRLVDDLLDVSRVTRGKVELKQRPLNLAAAAAAALHGMQSFAAERGQVLVAHLPEEPLWALADPVRFEQLVNNLVHNAIKYSDPGKQITLTVEREAERAAVHVADTGLGIAPEALSEVFEPFVQVGRAPDRSQGGLGLGLTLVKRLVELHGGTVTASSPGLGKGSVFTVRLPLIAAPPVEEQTAPPHGKPARAEARGGVRVMVVDDNLDAAVLLGEVLELEGHEVAVEHSGPSALERISQFAPQVVLLDIGLPGMDGLEVARRLRQTRECAQALLVAVSGYGQRSDLERSRRAGFDAHLVKPVDIDELRQLIARSLESGHDKHPQSARA